MNKCIWPIEARQWPLSIESEISTDSMHLIFSQPNPTKRLQLTATMMLLPHLYWMPLGNILTRVILGIASEFVVPIDFLLR